MYRQVIVYLCMAPALCSLLMVPVVQYVLLYTSAITGLCVLWLSIGWFIAYYRMPSVKLSSKGKAVLITGTSYHYYCYYNLVIANTSSNCERNALEVTAVFLASVHILSTSVIFYCRTFALYETFIDTYL